MPLRTVVKVSHISNLSDARYCAGMGVEMLGFAVTPSQPAYTPPQVFQDIRGWISGPKIVAELYGISGPHAIEGIIRDYAPDYFELTYAEYSRFSDFLSLPCIVYLPSGTLSPQLSGSNSKIAYVIVDEDYGFRTSSPSIPVLVKTTSVHSLNKKLQQGILKGIVLEGPKELRPGVTNYEQLGGILEALEEEPEV
jgi:phosphoribosylanthranilate isomerase